MKKFLSSAAFYPVLGLLAIAGIVVFRLIFTPVSIQTGSMEPALPVGTIVFVQSTDSLERGDIITFRQPDSGMPTTHRFIGFAEDGSLMTQGDANATPDVHAVPLQQSDVMGEFVFALPFLTGTYWTSPTGILSIIIMAGAILWIVTIKVKSRRETKNKKGLPSDTVPEETRELTPA